MKSDMSLPTAWALGLVLCAILGWPVILLPLVMDFAPYAAMGEPATAFGWKAWLAWLLITAAAWVLASRIKTFTPRQEDATVAAVLAWCAALVSLVAFSLLPESETKINRLGSTYLYTMPVAPVPPDPDYDSEKDPEYTTPHAKVPRISYMELPYADRKPDNPCADVYLGLLGGQWADGPYTCGTRPGRKVIAPALREAGQDTRVR